MKQKFGMLTFVHVSKDMPASKRHFYSDFDAIVEGTYSQLHGGFDIKSYSLWMIKDGKVWNRCSWYEESQLTELPEQDRVKAEEMIEAYNLR